MNRRQLLIRSAWGAGFGATFSLRAEPAAPVLVGRTIEGQAFDLQAEQGKVVLVFFWSTDCAVCRDKMPELRLNYEGWRTKGFQLIGVSVDKSLAAVQGYQQILDRTVAPAQRFPSLWRGAPMHRDSFGPIARTPTTFVLDRRHKVVNEIRGRIAPALWDDIAELVLA